MLTSKQRAYLRSKANTLNVITQIGKEGVSRQLVAQIDGALRAHELIKLHVLENSGEAVRDVAEQLASACKATVVTVIGNKMVLYRPASDPRRRKIELPKS